MMFRIREMRLEQAKLVAQYKEQEDALADLIFLKLGEAGLDKGSGKFANFTVTKKTEPKVADWDAFYEHVRKTKSWELLQKHPGVTAIKDRWAAGKQVPGVEQIEITDYSLTKR
jgi:hypothetical protein